MDFAAVLRIFLVWCFSNFWGGGVAETLFCLRPQIGSVLTTSMSKKGGLLNFWCSCLRGPAAILFILRDTFSDSIAKRFHACFPGVSHKYRAICCKMGYRTDMSL